MDADADAIFSADPANMVALFAHLKERYGTVAGYASAIGVPDDVVDSLRQAMLEPEARREPGTPQRSGRIRSIAAASARSSTVSPPESCVVSTRCTLFHRMSMSGW